MKNCRFLYFPYYNSIKQNEREETDENDDTCSIGYSGGKHLDSLTPKKGSTKAKNELRKRKKLIEARFDTVLQV